MQLEKGSTPRAIWMLLYKEFWSIESIQFTPFASFVSPTSPSLYSDGTLPSMEMGQTNGKPISSEPFPKSDVLECKVCCHQYSDKGERIPRILTSCGHTLCQSCLKKMQQMSMDLQSVTCPFDRKITRAPFEKFPKNFIILEILHGRCERAIWMLPTPFCADPDLPCFENPKHESTKYCVTCKVDFCDNCFRTAHSAKVFASHESVLVENKPFVFPNCPTHPTMVSEYICTEKHCTAPARLCCLECFDEAAHNGHRIELINGVVNQNEQILCMIVQELKLSIDALMEDYKNASRCVRNITRDHPGYKYTVDSIKSHYDQKKEAVLKQLDDIVDAKNEKLEEEKENIETDLNLLTRKRREIEKTLKQKNTLFVQEMIESGEALCSSKVRRGDTFDAFAFPTLQEILTENHSSIPSSSIPSTSNSWALANAPLVHKNTPPPPPKRRHSTVLSIFVDSSSQEKN